MNRMKRAWVLLALLFVAACKNGPSEDQCKQLLDHLVDLEFKKAGAAATSDAMKQEIAKQKTQVTEAKKAEFIETAEISRYGFRRKHDRHGLRRTPSPERPTARTH